MGKQSNPVRTQELIDGRIFELFSSTADALISLHEGWINEAIYIIVERVRLGKDRSREEAETLAKQAIEMAEAFGLPIIRDLDITIQKEHGLQRSFECVAVIQAGVPALTPELGSPHIIEEQHLDAAITGIRNMMRKLNMLPTEPEHNTQAPDPPVEYPVGLQLTKTINW